MGSEQTRVATHVPSPPRNVLARTLALSAAAWVSFGIAGCAAPPPRSRVGGEVRVENPDAADSAEMLDALVAAHNRVRESAGLAPLAVSDRLAATAQGHADDMAGRRRMSHRGGDGSSPFRRMEAAGYRYQRAGENVAQGQRSVADVMASWMASPGHKRNILGKFTEIGAGRATDENGTPYWCVTFGAPWRRE